MDLLTIYDEIELMKEEMPYTDDEKALLIKRLTPVLRTGSVNVSPTTALVVAAGIITAPRLLTVANAYQNKDEREARKLL